MLSSSFASFASGVFGYQAMMLRAMENTIYFASVNYALPYQESATSLIDPSGRCQAYLPYGTEGVLVQAIEESVLLVENVAVHPTHQRGGLGLALVTFAETTARRNGLSAMRLFTHERMTTNVAWYERQGFVISGTEPIGSGRLVHLRKDLPGGG